MNRKEQWIDEVMSSLDGLKQAQAPPDLQSRIMEEWAKRKPGQIRISGTISWSLAAGLLLLVSLNVFSIVHYKQEQQKIAMKATSREVAIEYFSSVSN